MNPWINLQRMIARAAFITALTLALAGAGCKTMAPDRGESLTATEADLKAITGTPIKVHVSPRMTLDPSLPAICKEVVEAFRSAAEDPDTRKRLGPMVHRVDILDWNPPGENFHAVVYREVLTIQALPDFKDIGPLRPLVAGVLKKAAHEVETERH